MARTVAVLQSNYIPWKGYFDIIHDVDLFVFYDDVQFTKNDWRNRNLIKTAKGPTWLSIPVGARIDRKIHEVQIKDHHWPKTHWRMLRENYASAPFFNLYEAFLREVYLLRHWENLSVLNQYLIKTIARQFLQTKTDFADSRSFELGGERQERLIELLRIVGATRYVSGPAARTYIAPSRFEQAGIELAWKSYDGYPEYPQFHPPFTHSVSILDLLFHKGPVAADFIWKR